MKEVTFKGENGFCPSYRYKDVDFYIKDKRDYKGDWVYSLWVQNKKKQEIQFVTHEEAIKHVRDIKGTKCVYNSGEKRLYISTNHHYIISGNTITKRETPTPISGDFDSYLECLSFSKKYVENYIAQHEPQQITLI